MCSTASDELLFLSAFVSHCDCLIVQYSTLVSLSLVPAMMEALQTLSSILSNVHPLTHLKLDRWHPTFAGPLIHTPEKLCMKFAIWVAHCNWPFAIIEDPELLDTLCDLISKVETPSQQTVYHDIKHMFNVSQKLVAKKLQVC